MSSTSKIFQPIQLGDLQLHHQVVQAPMTHLHSVKNLILPIVREYYMQRAMTSGTLIISEGSVQSRSVSPGIFTEEQIAAWLEVTNLVNAQGSFMYCQLFAMGRAATIPELANPNVVFDLVSVSAIPLPGQTVAPHALMLPEIKEYIQLFVDAADNVVNKAGFDGVEVHARTVEYGGNPENRARIFLEIVAATAKVVGESKIGVSISPWSSYQGMLMEDPIPTFSYVVRTLRDPFPSWEGVTPGLGIPTLAYLHIIEPHTEGSVTVEWSADNQHHSNDFIREIWGTRPLISAGGYSRESAMARADETGEMIAFGSVFLANPDLPLRLEKNIPLTRGDRSTYYVTTSDPAGYTSYPFATTS
ncbi:hypothetical protein B0H10DRAFT_2159550 [Mycena sp. CBHHK59/15]|nr:hypothetical protein B0H10DRAFT_2159550 [Mycena sp. CBHHK59/15]